MTLEKPKTVADVLEAAADLIEPEGAWCQHDFARNRLGENTGLSEFRGKAVCWCALGATAKAAGDDHVLSHAADQALHVVVRHESVADWNDHPSRKQAEVVAALRSAASLSRQNEEKANG